MSLAPILLFIASEPVDSVKGVITIRNVTYHDGPDHDGFRHKLDVYSPIGATHAPVVVFIHGGGWSMGSKDGFLLTPGHRASEFGAFFARHGFVAVLVNYRLSPRVKHPAHVTDVARSVAWVRKNIHRYNGDPDRVCLCGHSAGGHIAALLATDPQFLRGEGIDPGDLRGVIGVSGVYSLSGDLSAPAAGGGVIPGEKLPAPAILFGHVFGDTPADHYAASPIRHVRPGVPPFLIAYAESDFPTLAAQARGFHSALVALKNDARLVYMPERSHQSILQKMILPNDPLGVAVIEFLQKCTRIPE